MIGKRISETREPGVAGGRGAGPRSGAVQWMRLNEEEISPGRARAVSDWAEVEFLRSYLKTEEKKCMRP